jgi:cellulose synthase/poly-beta-1,6-N-acetylglucosamine synthase-like glycosyltransferase
MTDIEIPFKEDRGYRYRFFEMLPGMLSWFFLALPFLLSLINVTLAVVFILGYLLLWFVRAIGINIRALQGYRTMKTHQRLDWLGLLEDLERGVETDKHIERPKWHFSNISRVAKYSSIKPSDLTHVALVALYKETVEVVEPTIKSILNSDYDLDKIILVLAYEERGGEATEILANDLIQKYNNKFLHAFAVKHPNDLPGETIGKGGNITYAGRELKKYLESKNMNPLNVVVTTLDADNRPDKKYFASLSYTYIASLDPLHISFQPIPMYTNNIWDAPAPMRVIATGNSFWNVVLALRPHMLRNFSSHAQSMATLIDTDFWSVRTIVEDGHQFWRTYFRYDGNHKVYPVYTPIYQDAVFSGSYIKTLKAQFIQLRRWTYGASDVAYVSDRGFFSKNKVKRSDLIRKFLRLLEGHVTWAVAPLILAFSAFIPVLFNPNNYAANALPLLVSRIQTVALIGVFIPFFISIKTLPPKPSRYKAHRSIFMVLQWLYLPITTIAYNSAAALYSQTRLMLGLYYDKFDFTEKGVVTKTDKS